MLLRNSLLVGALLSACSVCSAAPAFKETFDDSSWEKRWKQSSWKKSEGEAGTFTLTAGKWYGDAEADKGIQTGPDARFFAYYSKLDKPFDNTGKDLVLQFSVKHEQKIDCGGGYIKLIPSKVSDKEMSKFSGETPYTIMFGPDICGFGTKKTHVILTHNDENHLISKEPECKTDEITHVYTLVLSPNNTYEVLIDTESVQSGSIEEDWNILKPRTIADPDAKKPEDWDERPTIPDPEDIKPEGYDDIPKTIPDADAKKPDDWDDDEDGAWEPPQIPNPEYKGEWSPKMIDNPDYKGTWEPPQIDNPEFKEDKELYKRPPIGYVAFELWQVKAGTIFDNIMLTDSKDEAMQFAKDTWGKSIEKEKEMKEQIEAEERKKKEEEAAAAAEASKGDESDDIDDASDFASATGSDLDSDSAAADAGDAAKDEL